MSENWKWIKMINDDIEYDYTDMYRIYIDGKVESVKRFGVKQNRFLKEGTDKKGYKVANLSKDGKRKIYFIHRLVACHFIENPHNFPVIDHINQVKDDNSIENLRWCSNATNQRNLTNQRTKHDLPRGITITPYGKYRVQISINRKRKNLGNYKTKEEASIVYEEARLIQINKELNNMNMNL